MSKYEYIDSRTPDTVAHRLTIVVVSQRFPRLPGARGDHVKFEKRYLRPTEVDALIGDPRKAEKDLGWKTTIDGRDLARIMVDADIEALEHAGRPWIDNVNLPGWGTE